MPSMYTLLVSASLLGTVSLAQKSLYVPCPLLGSSVPIPLIDPTSDALQSASKSFTQLLDQYVAAGDGDFGPITPITTSFSIALFAGSNYIAGDDDPPFFYEYHHAAGCSNDADCGLGPESMFAVGDLTQVFTVYTLLAELGDSVLGKSIVEYLPELIELTGNVTNPITQVEWRSVTLGSLAGHMAGIARDSYACQLDQPCAPDHFMKALAARPPVYLPDTTPIFSNAAFQLLATAMEQECGRPFEDIFTDRILRKLNMTNSQLLSHSTLSRNILGHDTHLFGNGLANASFVGEPAALSLVSTIRDLSLAGRAMLTSKLITPAETRRWLKPITSTSNIRNTVGRHWEIYHSGGNDSVADVYTKPGSIGRYSSYFGFAPDYDVGFVILAVDEVKKAPDLNAYVDVAFYALLEIQKLAYASANVTVVGTYTASSGAGDSKLRINSTDDWPGLAVASLTLDETDWLAEIAQQAAIKPDDLDFRIYPTNLEDYTSTGKQQAFRAVIQDESALVDAGTPTCISWRTVDELQRAELPLDRLIFDFDKKGVATAVSFPALGMGFKRQD